MKARDEVRVQWGMEEYLEVLRMSTLGFGEQRIEQGKLDAFNFCLLCYVSSSIRIHAKQYLYTSSKESYAVQCSSSFLTSPLLLLEVLDSQNAHLLPSMEFYCAMPSARSTYLLIFSNHSSSTSDAESADNPTTRVSLRVL